MEKNTSIANATAATQVPTPTRMLPSPFVTNAAGTGGGTIAAAAAVAAEGHRKATAAIAAIHTATDAVLDHLELAG
jgi:hypothetical protein